jgi:hypothetical protein
MSTTSNRILPTSSQYNAIVEGRPTGLAGCTQSNGCSRAPQCLRADARLPYRVAMALPGTGECRAFILAAV